MSTAEQIIAEHLPMYGGDVPVCSCRKAEWEPAHVVAALTNAGKTIVDSVGIYVEYGIERDMPSGGTRVVAAYDRSTAERVMAERPHDTRLVERRGHIGEWAPAAARVAEGGERGE